MEKYIVDKVIGEGTYGIVYKATEKGSNDHVAIKKFKTVQDEQLSKREIQACSMLSHANIVSYRHNFRHDGLLHLVFDYVPDSMNKLLARNRRGVKPALAQRLIYQLCRALQYCHASRVIHRDVKPDNILLDDNGNIRLCDFGVARTIQFEGDPLSDYVATRWYRPPEQELRLDRYSFDADMWSVGCVLIELLTGRPLFPGNTQIDQLNLIQVYLGPLPPPLASKLPRGVSVVKSATKSFEELLGDRDLPDGTLDFLYQTIHLEPKHRLSAGASLRHPFLKPLFDAEQRERSYRQQEEKQRRSRHCLEIGSTDSEDGIEEELPGAARHAEAKSPVDTPKVGPRSIGFKGVLVGEESRGAKSTRCHGSPKQRSSENKRAHESKGSQETSARGKLRLCGDNNPTDCDSDDIQEIIEMEHDMALVSPSTKARAPRREPSSDYHQECYEDDFEN